MRGVSKRDFVMRGNKAAADSSVAFKAGDFVKFSLANAPPPPKGAWQQKQQLRIEPQRAWGCDAGVVISQYQQLTIVLVNAAQKDHLNDTRVPENLRAGLWGKIPKSLLKRCSVVSTIFLVKYEVSCMDKGFPILQLPLPALALVLHSLGGIDKAAWASVTCKRFHSAFRHELIWKEKTLAAAAVVKAESLFCNNWFETYRDHACWTIHVLRLFFSRVGVSLSRSYVVKVNPLSSLQRLLHLMTSVMEMEVSVSSLRPHNPVRLGFFKDGQFVASNPEAKPNCRFDVPDKNLLEGISLVQCGLCDGAVLELPEQMMCD